MTLEEILARIAEIQNNYQDVRITYRRNCLNISYHDYDRDVFGVESEVITNNFGSISMLKKILNSFKAQNLVWSVEL